jgi:hypothetical protein
VDGNDAVVSFHGGHQSGGPPAALRQFPSFGVWLLVPESGRLFAVSKAMASLKFPAKAAFLERFILCSERGVFQRQECPHRLLQMARV